MKKQLCACGHIHELESGWTLYSHRDRHEQPTAATYLDGRAVAKPVPCACGNGQFVDAKKYEKFRAQHAAHLAKLETPAEQAKIAAELERMRAVRENPNYETPTDLAERWRREAKQAAKLAKVRTA
jgi:hypothetical protein